MDDDVDRIMQVMALAFDPHWREAWNRAQVMSSLALPTTHYRLANAKGDPPQRDEPAVGFTMVRSAPGEDELLLIGVTPQFRGRGIGRRLLELLAADARSRGAQKVFLEMRENNPAVRLYSEFGFKQIGRRKDYYKTAQGSPIDALTFALIL